jgi:hypothetical protein
MSSPQAIGGLVAWQPARSDANVDQRRPEGFSARWREETFMAHEEGKPELWEWAEYY